MHTRYLVPAVAVPAVAFAVASAGPASAALPTDAAGTSVAATGATTTAKAAAGSAIHSAPVAATTDTGKASTATGATTTAKATAAGAGHSAPHASTPATGKAPDATQPTSTAKTTVAAATGAASPAVKTTAAAATRATRAVNRIVDTATHAAAGPPAALPRVTGLAPPAVVSGVIATVGPPVDRAASATRAATHLVRGATGAATRVTAVTQAVKTTVDAARAAATSTPVSTFHAAASVLRLKSTTADVVATSVSGTGGGRPLGAIASAPGPIAIANPLGPGLPAVADPFSITRTPTVESTHASAIATKVGGTGPAGRTIAPAVGPAIGPAIGSPVLGSDAWFQSSTLAAPNAAPAANPVSAFGVDPSIVWQPARLDPVRIADQERANGGHTTTTSEASVLHEMFFGWFGKFMAFTGANLLRLMAFAVGLMMLGTAMLAARRITESRVTSAPS